jgi:hypothetical protein
MNVSQQSTSETHANTYPVFAELPLDPAPCGSFRMLCFKVAAVAAFALTLAAAAPSSRWSNVTATVHPEGRSGMPGAFVEGLVIFGGCSSSCCYG